MIEPSFEIQCSEDCKSMPIDCRIPWSDDIARKPAAATIEGVMKGNVNTLRKIFLCFHEYRLSNHAIGIPIHNATVAETTA